MAHPMSEQRGLAGGRRVGASGDRGWGPRAWGVVGVLPLLAVVAAGCPPREDKPIEVRITGPGDRGVELTPQEVLAAAKTEGELWWCTSVPDKAADRFLAAFQKEYPFINAHYWRAGTFDVVNKVERELESGDVRTDVLHVLDVGVFLSLKRQGELLRYEPLEARAVAPELTDPGYWWGLRNVAICMAYNPRKLPPSQAPKTWQDLLRPELNGRIAIKDATSAGSAYAEYFFLRQLYGSRFWEQLAGNQPTICKSAQEVMTKLLAANSPICVAGEMVSYQVYTYERLEKQPVVGIWPTEGVPMIVAPVAILARAPHPNAAKLFVNFALSQRGQAVFQDLVGSYSVRDDVPPRAGEKALSQIRQLTPEDGWDEYLEKQPELRAEFNKFFHPGLE